MGTALQDRPSGLRERIIDAALQVIREHGMTRARTSAIAEAAGCAEGSIYRYFSGKPELLEEVVRSRLPAVMPLLGDRPLGAGTATVRTNLLGVSRATVAFYAEVVPLAAGVLADAELREKRRRLLDRSGLDAGAADAVAAYLRAEQELGRVRASADPQAVARVLISSCVGESFLDALSTGEAGAAERERIAAEAVEVLISGLDPDHVSAREPAIPARRAQ